MPDLNDTAVTSGDVEQLIRFVERRRDRFFDECVASLLQRAPGDVEMFRRWNDNADCVHGREKLVQARHRGDPKLARDFSRAFVSHFDESNQLDSGHVAQNPQMVEAETSGTHHADANRSPQITTPRPLASTKRTSSETSAYGSSSVSARSIACETLRSERKRRR